MAPKTMNKTATGKKDSKSDSEESYDEVEQSTEVGTDRVLNADEAEELEEAQDAASTSEAQSGNAAELAAVSSGTADSASFKNFRHHPDMENFYRFIYENDLRHEALAIIDQITQEKLVRKQVKLTRSQPN